MDRLMGIVVRNADSSRLSWQLVADVEAQHGFIAGRWRLALARTKASKAWSKASRTEKAAFNKIIDKIAKEIG